MLRPQWPLFLLEIHRKGRLREGHERSIVNEGQGDVQHANTENQRSIGREKSQQSYQNTRLDHAQNPRVLAMIEVYPSDPNGDWKHLQKRT